MRSLIFGWVVHVKQMRKNTNFVRKFERQRLFKGRGQRESYSIYISPRDVKLVSILLVV
jgi:hypothetical protein